MIKRMIKGHPTEIEGGYRTPVQVCDITSLA